MKKPRKLRRTSNNCGECLYFAEEDSFRNDDGSVHKDIWRTVKMWIIDALDKIGLPTKAFKISDNELRYVLWRSYNNLERKRRSVLDEAKDVSMRKRLNIENYADKVADGKVLYRGVEEDEKKDEDKNKKEDTLRIKNIYDEQMKTRKVRFLQETQDEFVSLKQVQDIIEKKEGKKIDDFENVWLTQNHGKGAASAQMHTFDNHIFSRLMDEMALYIRIYGVR